MINVLAVEDSPVIRDMLTHIFNSEKDICLVGIAKNGREAIDMVQQLHPDVVTMDVNLPVMNCLEATRKIMGVNPVPIIIVSSEYDPKNMNDTFKALQAGAVAIAEKPHSIGTEKFKQIATRLIQTIRLMAEVKVVRRMTSNYSNLVPSKKIASDKLIPDHRIQIVGIGASTGGPQVIEKLLSHLNKEFSFPVVVVQHITTGFVSGYIEWLNSSSSIHVKLAEDNEVLISGICYIAPDNSHIMVTSQKKIKLLDTVPENGSKPSVSVLFKSIAKHYGSSAIGILLSGMGKDGAAELGLIKANGGITLVQDELSSVIFGMPGEAIRMNSASYIFSPEQMIEFLNELDRVVKNI